jgi:hypothetical protein
MENSTMEKRYIQKYWKEVVKRSFKPIWEEMTMRVLIIALILLLLSAGISGILLALGLIPNDLFVNRVAEAQAGISTFVVSLGVFVVLFVMRIYKTPVQMYQELGGFIENPFRLVPRPPVADNRPAYIPRSASLTVENISPFVIEECFLTLERIIDEDGEDRLYSRQRKLSWSSGEAQDENYGKRVNHPLDVISGVQRVADMAEAQLERLVPTVWRGEQFLPVGIYEMHITAHGTWRGHDIRKSGIFILNYKGGNNVEVTEKSNMNDV